MSVQWSALCFHQPAFSLYVLTLFTTAKGTLHTTNAEAIAWRELSHFRVTILNHPWVVSHEEQRRSLEEADGTRHRKEERLLRKQERDHKNKVNRKSSGMRKVEGKIQAKGSVLKYGKNVGRRMEKQ